MLYVKFKVMVFPPLTVSSYHNLCDGSIISGPLVCSQFFTIKTISGTSLVAQWLRICLPMQETQVRTLVREDSTCRRATKPVRHNY